MRMIVRVMRAWLRRRSRSCRFDGVYLARAGGWEKKASVKVMRE